MRISDWSSDVCSSDLIVIGLTERGVGVEGVGIGTAEIIVPVAIDGLDRIGVDIDAERIANRRQRQSGSQQEIAIGARRLIAGLVQRLRHGERSEEHTSELQSLMRLSYAVFCLQQKNEIRHTY